MIYSGFKNSNRAIVGTWPGLIAMLEKYSIVVLKPKSGSMGRSTYKVENQLQLEQPKFTCLARFAIILRASFPDKNPLRLETGCAVIARNTLVLL